MISDPIVQNDMCKNNCKPQQNIQIVKVTMVDRIVMFKVVNST